MKTQAIEVEGFPEGYKTSNFRYPIIGEKCWSPIMGVYVASASDTKCFIVEKIQPRRIVLEETEEKHLGCQTLYIDDTEFMIMTAKVWREVNETDVPIHNDEPKLSLNKKDMLELIEHIKLGGQLNPKIAEFIKENS